MRRAGRSHVRTNQKRVQLVCNGDTSLAPSLRSKYVKSYLLSANNAKQSSNNENLDSSLSKKNWEDPNTNVKKLMIKRKQSMQRGESPRTGLMPTQTLAGSRSCEQFCDKRKAEEHRKFSDFGLSPPTIYSEKSRDLRKAEEFVSQLRLQNRTWKSRLVGLRRIFRQPAMRKISAPPSFTAISEEKSDDEEDYGTVLKRSITFCETTKERFRRSLRRNNARFDDRVSEKVTKRRNSVFVKRGSVSMEPIKKIVLEDVYTVYKQLGTGRFGFVKLAEHIQSKQKIAIKFFSRPPTKQVDFIREYNYSFFLSPHQHIIDTYEGMFQSSDETSFFFVQEFCPRASIREAVEATNQQGIGELRTKQVFSAVLSAIEFMHSENLVHRNLKAENILLFDSHDFTKVKVTDFGLTRKVDSTVKYLEYVNNYHAPELCETVVNEVLTVNRSSDVWALGVIFFYCMRGRFPWQKASIMCKAYWEWEQWLKRKNPSLPKKWIPFSEKALKLMKKTLTPRYKDRWTAKDMRKCIAKEKLLKAMKTDTSGDFVYHSTDFGRGPTKLDPVEVNVDSRRRGTLQQWISTTLSTMAEISEQVVSARDD